jgi:hypothetical protein
MKFYTCKFMLLCIVGITPICYAKTSADTTSIEDVKQEAQNMIQTLNAYTADRRGDAIEKAKFALDDLDKRIDALETGIDDSWGMMNEDARKNARASLKKLRGQRIVVAEWYGRLKSSSNDAWGQMRTGFSDAYSAVNSAWEKAKKEFDSEQ